jgi:uncharacterized membrane protein
MGSYFARKVFKQIRTNIIAGVFILIPVVVSIYIIVKLFIWTDSALPAIFGAQWTRGVGILVTIILAYLVGLAAKNWLGRRIIAGGNAIIATIPILNKIYQVIKQIIDTISVDKKKLFERAVLVEFPRKESYAVGFVTAENNARFSARAGRKLVAVFVPSVPNPTTGFLMYVPEEDLIDLGMPVESALKIVVSGGIIGTDGVLKEQKLPTSVKHWNWMDIFRGSRAKKKPRHLNDPRD